MSFCRLHILSRNGYPWKIATRLPVSFVHADGWIMSPANLHDCETNQFHFSLSPLDIISTVVTQFLSPSIGNDSNWALCWQASTHGWAGTTFHSRCDGKSHTITVIRKDPYVSGGYTDIPWCKWLFRPGRGNKRDGVRKIKIKPVKKPNWTSLSSIWQIIKQVTNSEPIKSFNDINCLLRHILKFSAVFDTKRWPV